MTKRTKKSKKPSARRSTKSQKASATKAAPQISVVDVSSSTVRRVVVVGVIALMLLAVFPYRHSARASAPFLMLADFYGKQIVNASLARANALPSLVVGSDVTTLDASGVPVLMYHGVMHHPDSYNIDRTVFEDHLSSLHAAGWRTVTLDAFRAYMRGEQTLPDRSFLLTFDDGRKDSYYPVDPLLTRYGYSAVMFVLPQYSIENDVDSPYYLNRTQIEDMHASGRWDIESHTWDAHSFFPTDHAQVIQNDPEGIFLANLLWNAEENRRETPAEFRARVRADLLLADTSVKDVTGQPVTTIAFPFGNYGQTKYNFPDADEIVLEESQKIHDHGFFQIRNGLFRGHGLSVNYPDSDTFLIRRIDVNPRWGGDDVLNVLEAGKDHALPFRSSMQDFIGWVVPAGISRHDGAGIVFESAATESRVEAFLDGGGLWSDYSVEMDVQWDLGATFDLRAYDQRDGTPISCRFDRANVPRDRTVTLSLVQRFDGVTCLVDGVSVQWILSADANEASSEQGTVSFRVEGTSSEADVRVRVQEVRVESANTGVAL